MAGSPNLFMSIYSGSQSRSIRRSQNQVWKAEADAANLIREAQNESKAAQTGLAYFMQTENNKRRLAAGAKNLEAGVMNLQRMQDAFTSGNLEAQLAAAEAGGAYAAHVAMTGTGGNAVDMIDRTMQLKNARAAQARDKAQGQATYDTMAQISGIMPQTVAGLDLTYVNAGIDYSQSIAKENLISDNIWSDVISAGEQAMSMITGIQSQPSAANGQAQNTTGGIKASPGNYEASDPYSLSSSPSNSYGFKASSSKYSLY